jgi:hypothetical protein
MRIVPPLVAEPGGEGALLQSCPPHLNGHESEQGKRDAGEASCGERDAEQGNREAEVDWMTNEGVGTRGRQSRDSGADGHGYTAPQVGNRPADERHTENDNDHTGRPGKGLA